MGSGEAEEGFDNWYSICGFLGGVVFALSLLPQLWHSFSTKSTADLSYVWQFTYMVGLTGIGVYYVAYSLWPVLVPGIVDFLFMAVLTGMKFYFDTYQGQKADAGEAANENPVKDDSEGAACLTRDVMLIVSDEKDRADRDQGQDTNRDAAMEPLKPSEPENCESTSSPTEQLCLQECNG